ncbi:hypothetical protein BD779DRAFT_1477105 [Infundibulicybe gibba]|nr:hypothetical protein BD779DRAFT_1477105 [Infundibulicybe gibba]
MHIGSIVVLAHLTTCPLSPTLAYVPLSQSEPATSSYFAWGALEEGACSAIRNQAANGAGGVLREATRKTPLHAHGLQVDRADADQTEMVVKKGPQCRRCVLGGTVHALSFRNSEGTYDAREGMRQQREKSAGGRRALPWSIREEQSRMSNTLRPQESANQQAGVGNLTWERLPQLVDERIPTIGPAQELDECSYLHTIRAGRSSSWALAVVANQVWSGWNIGDEVNEARQIRRRKRLASKVEAKGEVTGTKLIGNGDLSLREIRTLLGIEGRFTKWKKKFSQDHPQRLTLIAPIARKIAHLLIGLSPGMNSDDYLTKAESPIPSISKFTRLRAILCGSSRKRDGKRVLGPGTKRQRAGGVLGGANTGRTETLVHAVDCGRATGAGLDKNGRRQAQERMHDLTQGGERGDGQK